jgi:hypothetical protein
MLDPATILKLASIAHGLWCEQMERKGWKHGSEYNAHQKIHDALVPFDRLTAQDRRHVCLGIEAEECERLLIAAVRYQRGPDREFTIEELKEGLAVAMSDPNQPGGLGPERGKVESWSTDGQGELVIRVRWRDGSESEHLACVRELARV